MPALAEPVRSPAPSLLRMSALQRLAFALLLIGAIWAVVYWAMR